MNRSKILLTLAVTLTFFISITAQNFKLRIEGDGRIIGRLDVDDTRSNAFIGREAGAANVNGFYNTATGFQGLFTNTSGQYNTAIGYKSLYTMDGASNNTSVGNAALFYNEVGNNNTAVGSYALSYNEAHENTAVGYRSAFNNRSGTRNTALGFEALYSNQITLDNTAIGYRALYSNVNAGISTAIGAFAMEKSTAAARCTAVGGYTLRENLTGDDNTAVGYNTLSFNTTGASNVAVGSATMTNNQTGSDNVALGSNALYSINSGNRNIGIGSLALSGLTTGADNVAVGYQAIFSDNYTNSVAVGAYAQVLASNEVFLGNTQTTSIGGVTAWSNLSDKRFKQQIRNDVPGLDFIRLLEPVTYQLDRKAIAYRQGFKDGEGPLKYADAPGEIRTTGFLAQDVEAAAQKLGYEFSGVDKPQNKADIYGLRYGTFVVPLVKAVQELEAENTDLQQQLQRLERNNQRLEDEVAELRQWVQEIAASQQPTTDAPTGTSRKAFLDQNTPNPFSTTTRIRYYVPEGTDRAALQLFDAAGRLLRSIAIDSRGEGTSELDLPQLGRGLYFYALVLNGQVIETRKMLYTQP